MKLLPYLYSAFAEYNLNGVPPIRAMILEGGFKEGDAKVIEGKLDSETNPYATGKIIEKNDQFMFGPSIMVAPFYDAHAIKRSVQLPAGNWYDFYTGKFVGNNKVITVTAEALNDHIPLFVKEGSVIPMFVDVPANSKEAKGKDIVLRHYGKKAGKCHIYEDDALTFDYQKGSHRTRHISVSTDGKSTTMIKGEGPALFGDIKAVKQMTQ